MTRAVIVRAPARLHFGMFGFGGDDTPEFGGVGMMVSPPTVTVSVSSADGFHVTGLLTQRVQRCAHEFFRRRHVTTAPKCVIDVQDAPAEHFGLGTGTQLSLAIVTGLTRYLAEPAMSADELARCANRGRRSAVGTYGFVHGGLIVDRGRIGDSLGQLEARAEVPATWRVLLIRTNLAPGKSGPEEAQAFDRMPPVPASVRSELRRIALEELLPQLASGDCAAFGDAVYRYGVLAGECFADEQCGAFASPEIAELVAEIRRFGISGAGQSSWGPTVFTITCDQQQAESLAAHLQSVGFARGRTIITAQPCNHGAVVEIR